MGESTAWVLSLDGTHRAAVGEREMVYLMESPALFPVPESPFYCRQVLLWQGRILPLMDLAAWLTGRHDGGGRRLAGIFAYQARTGLEVDYGALLLAAPPVRTKVNDDQASELPAQPSGWQAVAVSCFTESGHSIPILSLSTLFSGALLHLSGSR